MVNRLKQHYSSCSMQDHPIIAENESIDLVARSTALSDAEDLLIRLKPISVALDRIHRENAIISDTFEVWKKLYEDLLSSQQPAHVLSKVDERAAQAILKGSYPALNCKTVAIASGKC